MSLTLQNTNFCKLKNTHIQRNYLQFIAKIKNNNPIAQIIGIKEAVLNNCKIPLQNQNIFILIPLNRFSEILALHLIRLHSKFFINAYPF